MSPMLSRIYGAPGGTEALDVLMKYMYGFSHSIALSSLKLTKPAHSYKGMAHATPQTASNTKSTLTPQASGFSQIHARGGGEGGGQAMSVLLSWHEKVRFFYLFPLSSIL
jgi:actin related protein 2/3 complex subunit 5